MTTIGERSAPNAEPVSPLIRPSRSDYPVGFVAPSVTRRGSVQAHRRCRPISRSTAFASSNSLQGGIVSATVHLRLLLPAVVVIPILLARCWPPRPR